VSALTVTATVTDSTGATATVTASCTITDDVTPGRWPGLAVLMAGAEQ
jgi:hypothetical protein